MAGLADHDALVDGHGGVGKRREMARAGLEDGLVEVKEPAHRHREDEPVLQDPANGLHDALDKMGLHGHHDHVGPACGLLAGRKGLHAARLRARLEHVLTAGGGAELLRLHRSRTDPAVGHGRRHVPEAQKRNAHRE